MIKNPLHRLYFFAGGAFLLALIKYFFVSEIEFLPKFFIIEFISFGLFLTIVYFFDQFIRVTTSEKVAAEQSSSRFQQENTQKIAELEKEIIALKSDVDNTMFGEEETNKIIKQITQGLDRISKVEELGKMLLSNFAKQYEVGLGVCYFYDKLSEKFSVKATYGLEGNIHPNDFVAGEGLNGQTVMDKKYMIIEDIDEEYFNIESCTGASKPKNIYLLPIIKEDECIGLIEIATFSYVYIDKYWEQLNNSIVKSMSL